MTRIEKKFIACKDAAHATVGKFYEFKNATETSVDLYFYGDIVSDWWGAWQEEDQYPEAIKNFLAEANGKDLNIYINSGGRRFTGNSRISSSFSQVSVTFTVARIPSFGGSLRKRPVSSI